MRTFRFPHGLPSSALLLAAVLVPAAAPARAADPEPKSGPIYYVNRTDVEITIEGRHLIDEDGDKVPLSASWTLKPGEHGYLTLKGKKVVARQLAYTLKTKEGTSDWVGTARALDKDGDFVLVLTPDNLDEHRKTAAGVKAPAADKAGLKARRSKEAWDAMGTVDAQTAPIAKRDAVEYWEKFNVGYGLIDKDDIDADLDRLIRDWVSVSSDYHGTVVKYQRTRDTLVRKRDNLGRCPDEAGPAFLWGLAFGALTRQISDLDDQGKADLAALGRRKADLEKREKELGRTLAERYPAHRFSR